ncbi:hypothetical protein ABZ801_39410 [Actinomadura sp. NPDC047616]|uniref:hypothetical protein n=1 Tax=Actinomadura sp. NPDC047616 TaxID=3155914 RepID=UPI0033C7C105
MGMPSDDELDALIRARLALAGVDLDQLPESPDPATGAPTRAQAMEYLRTFLAGARSGGTRTGGRPGAINTWRPPATGEDAAALAQQAAPPLEYPSITTAWTEAK